MPRPSFPLVAVFVVLVASACAAARPVPRAPSGAQSPGAGGGLAASASPGELAAALEETRRARESGDLAAARARLRAIFDEGIYERLLDAEQDVAWAGLAALEQAADPSLVPDLALRVREERVERLSAALEEDHPDLLRAQASLALAHAELGDFARALALEEAVHAARERRLPAEHPDRLAAQQSLALTRRRMGDLAGALELLEAVHAARARLLPEDHPDLLAAQQNLAVVCRELGRVQRALALMEAVHAARERLLPAGHPDLLAAKSNLAGTRLHSGDLAGAHELFQAVHAARERLLPAEHPDLLKAKQNLAITSRMLGDVAGAHALNEAVHAARERSLPAEHELLLDAKQNLAVTRKAVGDIQGALALEEAVHAARERRLPADHPALLDARLNLAVTRRELGDVVGAHALLESVHDARQRLLPAGHPDLLKARQNLAIARYALGDTPGALSLSEAVHEARESVLAPDHPELLAVKQNLAVMRKKLGDFAGALVLEEVLYAARVRLLPADHPDLLLASQNLANTRKELGDFAGALELEEAVLAARERLLPADHPDLVQAALNLAATRQRAGDLPGALAAARSALERQGALIAGLHGESPRFAREAALRELQRLPVALSVSASAAAADLEPLDAEIFGVIESARAVSIGSAEIAHAAASDPDLGRLRERVAASRRGLHDAIHSPPDRPEDLAEWRAALFARSEERDRLEKELRARIAHDGRTLAVTAADVARGLGPGSSLVSYLRYARLLEPDPATEQAPPPVDALLAFVVTPDARVRRVELGASREIEDLASRWRASVGRPIEAAADAQHGAEAARGIAASSAASAQDEAVRGAALRARVLDPCLASLGNEAVATLHLVLDDCLHLVPVDALPRGDGLVVGEALATRLESSARPRIASRPAPGAGRLLAVGGVDFDAEDVAGGLAAAVDAPAPPVGESPDRSGAAARFEPLAQTLGEVESLATLYERHRGEEAVVLHGAQASKAALSTLAPQARYLHVATHGWFAPETFASRLDGVEGESQRALFTRAGADVRGFAPETLCGLALAGANRGASATGQVPGILTAEELATLDLSRCELAVLSACETNVGLRRAGQGIQSLQAALHAAGARTAITSLWRVEDAATRRLMELFYVRLWGDGLGQADALWQAKMELRAEGRPTRDWAGWVLSGDPE